MAFVDNARKSSRPWPRRGALALVGVALLLPSLVPATAHAAEPPASPSAAAYVITSTHKSSLGGNVIPIDTATNLPGRAIGGLGYRAGVRRRDEEDALRREHGLELGHAHLDGHE